MARQQASTTVQEAAEERLRGVLALVRRSPGWLTPASFATDPVLPIASIDGVRGLASAVRELCGTPVTAVPARSEDPACASALVSGPRGSALVGCRVEHRFPHRVEEMVLLPTVGRAEPHRLPASATVTSTCARDGIGEEMEPWLTAARRDLNLVGVVAAVYDGSSVVWSGSAGQAALADDRVPDPADCVVRIGSVTKTMLVVRCLQLVEVGALRLADRVRDVLTSWPLVGAHADDLRIEHLLSHTGATAETPEERYFVPADGPEPELSEWLERPVEVIGVPGQEWSYSNVGMTLLGQVITDVTGRDFEDDVRAHVFEPIGMQDTSFRLEPALRPRVMNAFAEGYEGVAEIPPVHVGARAAGSVFSTLADMGRWAGEVVAGSRGDGTLLPAGAWRDCLSPVIAIPGTGMEMARGFLRVDDPVEPVVWHNGALPGASAQFWVAPRSGLTLAVFANVWSPWRTMVMERRCLAQLRRLTARAT